MEIAVVLICKAAEISYIAPTVASRSPRPLRFLLGGKGLEEAADLRLFRLVDMSMSSPGG
ncbi:hypothetical protein C5167_046158 [Papaver somniferum]|uniref:Uncharacterized protein n=1 Tax=Papaver somniferum TaxID=3469 RepID=A0A4Y7LFF3_PAPSO|nr:hypothetical protein C5167_046158 [Papaver somniferum]